MGIPSFSCLSQSLDILDLPRFPPSQSCWLCLQNLSKLRIPLATSAAAPQTPVTPFCWAARGVPLTVEVISSCSCTASQRPQSKPTAQARGLHSSHLLRLSTPKLLACPQPCPGTSAGLFSQTQHVSLPPVPPCPALVCLMWHIRRASQRTGLGLPSAGFPAPRPGPSTLHVLSKYLSDN